MICERLGVEPGPCSLRKFSNGETSIEIGVSVRDEDIYIVQSGSNQINDHIMELLILISGCKGGSAHKITAVIPMFPYAKQSKMKKHRGAITAKMLANLLIMAGADHVITMDLHASQMQGFFKKPVDNLYAAPTLARWIKLNISDYQNNIVIVSKNPGGTKRVTALADALKVNFAMIHTDRRRSQDRPLNRILPTSNIVNSRRQEGSGSTTSSLSPRAATSVAKEPLANGRVADPFAVKRSPHPLIEEETETAPANSHRSSSHESSFAEEFYLEEEESEPVNSHSIQIARVVQGHVVHDDYPESENPEPSVDSPSDQTGLADSMVMSNVDGAHALGGSIDATLSDDDEEDHFHETERLIALVGDVRDKYAIILDDMIDRPGSFIAAAEHCRINCGAKKVYILATHGVFSNGSLEALNSSPCIDHVVVTNTFPISEEVRKKTAKLTVIDISSIFAECIRRNHHGESISALFEQLVTL